MSAGRDQWRAAAVRTCELFFVLILLEGVLRKWLLNPIQQPLTLVRDPLLVVLYIQYAMYTRGRVAVWVLILWVLLTLFMIVIAIQSSYLSLQPTIYVIGVRNYLAYVPVAFIMMDVFNRRDLSRILRLILYSTIPVALLVVVQFYSPVGSSLNKGLDDSVEGIFEVVTGVARPYGPFTFVTSQVTYAALALAVGLIALERRKELALSKQVLFVCFAAIGSMGVVSGSRTYFLSAGLIFMCFVISAVASIGTVSFVRRAFYASISLVGLMVLVTTVFPQALETMLERQANAVEAEGATSDRALYIATEMFSVIGETPLFGRGIGFGTNAGAFVATGELSFTLAEYEWTRIVLECGPILGLLVIGMRVMLTMGLGILALRATLRRGDAAPLIMFGLVAPLIFYAQITEYNTLISLGWFSLGLLCVLIRTSVDAPSGSAATLSNAAGRKRFNRASSSIPSSFDPDHFQP